MLEVQQRFQNRKEPSHKLATCSIKNSLKRNHPKARLDWRWGWGTDVGILVGAERRPAKRAPLWVRGNLPRPPNPPPSNSCRVFNRGKSIIHFLQFTLELRLFIDFFMFTYGLSRMEGEGRALKSKQTQQNIAPLGVFNSQLPWSMTRSLWMY